MAFNPPRNGIPMRALVAVAAIAVLLAVAYALWGEQSQVSVSAQTGYIDLDFKVYGNPWMKLGGQRLLGLNYTLLGSEKGNDGPPVLILTLKNLYPFGYDSNGTKRYIVFDSLRLVNDGTIPVNITGCNFTYMSGSFEFGDVDYGGWLELDVDLYKGGRGPPSDVVLRPGESAVVAISIWVSDNATEGASVTVKFTCNYVQAVP